MKNLGLILIFSLLNSLSLNASVVDIDLDSIFPGQEIYACNIGIRHRPHSDRVCFTRDDRSVSCDPRQCSSASAESCNCVCTGSTISNVQDGESRLDFIAGSYSPRNQSSNINYNRVAGSNNFEQLFNNSESFNYEINSLSLRLGSERFGTEYYIDFCYRAPEEVLVDTGGGNGGFFPPGHGGNPPPGLGPCDNPGLGPGGAPGNPGSSPGNVPCQVPSEDIVINFNFNGFMSLTDLTSARPYSALSGLESRVAANCYSGSGTHQLGVSSWYNFSSSQTINFTPFQLSEKNIDKCKFRFYFRETRREGLWSLRPWNSQQSNVSIYLNADLEI